MSVDIYLNEPASGHQARVTLEFMEVRPDEGIIFRFLEDIKGIGLKGVADGLHAALRSSAFRIFRACCDSSPAEDADHAEGCEYEAPAEAKRGGRKEARS